MIKVAFVPLQGLLPEEISFCQCSDVLFFGHIGLFDGDFDAALAYDEEGVAPCSLSYYVVAVGVEGFLEDVRYLDEGVFGKILEDWNAANKINYYQTKSIQ